MKTTISKSGFSLTEVVIALAIVSVTLPVILGVFAKLSSSTDRVRDLQDVESVLAAIKTHLESDDPDANLDRFEEIYQSVYQARQNPDSAEVLYVYREKTDASEGVDAFKPLTVSEVVPDLDEVNSLDSRVVAVELHAPEETVLPVTAFPATFASFEKSYLPIRIDLFVAVAGLSEQKLTRPFETLPFVLRR